MDYLARLFLRCPAAAQAAKEPTRTDVFFPDYGAVVWRGRDARGNLWEIAAKAGHNGEHHNHNDCGSFILSLNGKPALIEIGAPEYVGDYFNSEKTRYEFLAARSLGHSVPLVNGMEQPPGAQFAARVLTCELDADSVKFVVDLTKCYPPAARCRQLVRTFLFEKKEGRLQVSDAFELEEPGEVKSMMICQASVSGDGSGARIEAGGGALRITLRENATFGGTETVGYRNRQGQEETVNRLVFRADGAVRAGVITCDIELL
jgi:hypothetical protein